MKKHGRTKKHAKGMVPVPRNFNHINIFKQQVMTLKEYINNLKLFAEKNPETLKMKVITSRDDEGNGYNPIYYSPSKGAFKDRDFIPWSESDENDQVNAVCVN